MDTTIQPLTDDTYAAAAAQPGIMVIDFDREPVAAQTGVIGAEQRVAALDRIVHAGPGRAIAPQKEVRV